LPATAQDDDHLIVVVEDIISRHAAEPATRDHARRQRLVATFARQALEVLMQGTRADCCRLLRMGAGAAHYRRVAQTG